jgi:hypothetical protein
MVKSPPAERMFGARQIRGLLGVGVIVLAVVTGAGRPWSSRIAAGLANPASEAHVRVVFQTGSGNGSCGTAVGYALRVDDSTTTENERRGSHGPRDCEEPRR